MEKKKMKINEVALITIKPYWRNARDNSKTIDALVKSIEKYGFNQPLVLDKENVIIVGHSRFKAAMQLGLETVPCVISDMEEVAAKEYRIADNKISELAEWKEDLLIVELRELPAIEEMAEYFPAIDLPNWIEESAGTQHQGVTSTQVTSTQEKIDKNFNAANQKAHEKYRQIACPHCGEDITLNEDDLRLALGESK